MLDQAMNNTNLILLFEIGAKKFLFSGDAQIENWTYALKAVPDVERVRELVADVGVYKVGHHGSLNATRRRSEVYFNIRMKIPPFQIVSRP